MAQDYRDKIAERGLIALSIYCVAFQSVGKTLCQLRDMSAYN